MPLFGLIYFLYFQFSTGRRNEITDATTQKIATGVKSYWVA